MTVEKFLEKHGQSPDCADADEYLKIFLGEMRAGLNGEKSSLAMLPSRLSVNAVGKKSGKKYIVIDAGGTNFRSALGSYKDGAAVFEDVKNMPMPGTYGRLSAEEFYSAMADGIKRLLPDGGDIGFCFSYPADIDGDCDGIIRRLEKGVDVAGAEGGKVGENLVKALNDFKARRAVVLNDTVAALIGGAARGGYSAYAGYIYGTGTNISCAGPDGMIINTECGNFDKFEKGDFDKAVINGTAEPDRQNFEKMTSGKYLADVMLEGLNTALRENMFYGKPKIHNFTLAELSEFIGGQRNCVYDCFDGADKEVARDILAGIRDRAAKLGAVANAAAVMFSGTGGKTAIVAEGTTFYKLHGYRSAFGKYLEELLPCGISVEIIKGEGNFAGALAAAEAYCGR